MSLYEITNGFDPKSNLTLAGVTDEVTECFCCGKKNLKRTVVLKDEWGQFSFYGTTCAYNALEIWNKSEFVQAHIKSATRAKNIKQSNTDTITASEVIETEINNIQFLLVKEKEPVIYFYSNTKNQWQRIGHIGNWTKMLQEEFQKKGTLFHVPKINLIAEFLDKYTKDGFPF